MATDVSSQVTVAIKVVDQATPAIESVTQSLKGIEQAQQQINETAAQMATNIPHSLAEMAAAAPGNIWNLPVRGADVVPDIAPAAQAAVDETAGIFETLETAARKVWENIRRGFSGAFDWIAGAAKKIGSTLASAFEPLAFIGGFAAMSIIDGAVTGLQKLVDTVGQLGPKAKDIGISIADLQRLTEWAKEGGAPVAAVTTALADLNRTLGGINLGAAGYKKQAAALEDLGIALEKDGHLKTVSELLPELAQAFQTLNDPQRAAADASGLFAQKWRVMLPLLLQGPAAMEAAAQAADKAGTIGPDLQKAVGVYDTALVQLQTSWTAFQEQLGAALIPAITPALQELTTLIQEHGKEIATLFTDVVEGLISLFKTVGPFVASTAKDLEGIATALKYIGSLIPEIKLPELKLEGDPITALRDTMIAFGKDVYDALQTPLVDVWKHITDAVTAAAAAIEPIVKELWDWFKQLAAFSFPGLTTAFDAIATAADKATAAYTAWKGETATPPVAVAPGGGPMAPPVAVAPGGGPMSWETLAGGAPGGPIVPGTAPNGTVNVVIQNKNPPPGQQVAASANGPGVKTRVDTGVSMPWSAPATDYSGGPWAPAGA